MHPTAFQAVTPVGSRSYILHESNNQDDALVELGLHAHTMLKASA